MILFPLCVNPINNPQLWDPKVAMDSIKGPVLVPLEELLLQMTHDSFQDRLTGPGILSELIALPHSSCSLFPEITFALVKGFIFIMKVKCSIHKS